ncbi:MAG: sulfotransferase [Pseudomonadales bacterium]
MRPIDRWQPMPIDIPATLRTAQQHLAQSNLSEAVVSLESILNEASDHRDALYYLAVIDRRLGQFDACIEKLDQLLNTYPRDSLAIQERAFALISRGDESAAFSGFRQAVTLNDALLASWRALAELARKLNHDVIREEAEEQQRRLSALPQPLLQTRSLIQENKLFLAERVCRRFLVQNPKHVEGMRLLAHIGVVTEVLDDAETLLAHAISFEPENRLARFDYMTVLYKRQKYQAAFDQANHLLELEPDNVRYKTAYANQCVALGRFDDAITIYDEVQDKVSDPSLVHLLKGHALKTIGQTEAAIVAYRDAAALRPDFGDAYWSLANLKTYRFTDAEVAAMNQHSGRPMTREIDDIHLLFALGKHYEDSGDVEAAFKAYEAGNLRKLEQLHFDGTLLSERMRLQITHCTPRLFTQKAGFGNPAPDPIFIVGLPRAGSTLLEQILSSHSQVEGTQELPNIASYAFELDGRRRIQDDPVYPGCLESLSEETCLALGTRYLEETRVHRSGKPFFIDKMPNNFRHIGLIRLMLPNAKIIDARRHPMACCFSGFKQLFSSGQEFTYGLENIGRYYKDYVDIMRHWDAVLPGAVLRVHHESVVFDLEGEVRRILEYCGLPFEASCLSFFESERSVRTPSSEQVRQPIFKTSLDAWQPFEPWLGPLKLALGDEIINGYPNFS